MDDDPLDDWGEVFGDAGGPWDGSGDDSWEGADDHDSAEDAPGPGEWGGREEIRFGQVLPQEGLSEDGNPVAYSTSYDEYYDTVTNEEVEPK
ncbi:hypothetical protein [Microbispora sp. NPDC049125]|uniref:hypothetical protein n=1 Tax=Microbispora sp. NPDC049125 TaxID=3154929 RepID=UPI003467B142